jgi:diacylglycerol kinase family enzyme
VIRCCGILRNTVWALIRMATLRRYTAVLSYRDAAGEWQTLEGSDWIGLWACNMPWMSEEDNPAPDAELDSGALDVLVVKGVGRISTLNMFLGIGEGTHLKKPPPGVSLVRATALRLDPRPRTAAKPGLLDVDGEFVPFGPIEGRCHPRALRVLSLPPAARGGE